MDDNSGHSVFSWRGTGRGIQRASLRAFDLSERAARKGWKSQQKRVRRWRSRVAIILQISLAAGLAWFIAQRVLGHEMPFLAVVAAIVCLGFSFGQRLWRAAEIAIGVTVGVALGDLFYHLFGHGVWQIILVIAAAMSITTWLGARTLMVTQAAVQAAIVLTIPPGTAGDGFARWGDALIGCAVALLFAFIAPIGPVERPRLQAAKVLHETAWSIRSMVTALELRDVDAADEVLARTRETETSMSALNTAVEEGVAVVRVSLFLRRHKIGVLQIADLVVPLDRFTRNLRVLARRAAVAVYREEYVPPEYLDLLTRLADVTEACSSELFAMRRPSSVKDDIIEVGIRTAAAPLGGHLSPAVMLAQMRSMLVDLLELCGEDYTDARLMVPQHNPNPTAG